MNDQPADLSSIDSFHVGRRRKPNFTDQEVLYIVDQYDIYKELLHSREASKSVIQKKQEIWKKITDNLNATYPQVVRTVEDVRRKWKKLQSEAKRESNAYRTAQQSGSAISISNKQITLYNRILSICRPSNTVISPSAHFTHPSLISVNAAFQQQQQALQAFRSMNADTPFNEQSSDKADSPLSELAMGYGGRSTNPDSPGDESPSLLGNDDNSSSPKSNLQSTSLASFLPSQATNSNSTSITNNGQISRRTMDKRRKVLKTSVNATSTVNHTNKPYEQQQTSLRYESLLKRKRTLELTSQRLKNDKQRLLLEQKNLEVKLAVNECECERLAIEKRRTDIALQKIQFDLPATSNENNNHNLSDQEDHDDNYSLDDMSDIND